jgi:hypothetical protein
MAVPGARVCDVRAFCMNVARERDACACTGLCARVLRQESV